MGLCCTLNKEQEEYLIPCSLQVKNGGGQRGSFSSLALFYNCQKDGINMDIFALDEVVSKIVSGLWGGGCIFFLRTETSGVVRCF